MDFQIQVLSLHGNWTTVCVTNKAFINDMLVALKSKFTDRGFRVTNKNNEVIDYDIF